MSKLVLATANRHKAEELRAMLPAGWEVRDLSDIGYRDPIDENASTIEGNSKLKARTIKRFLQSVGDESWVLADDSGLEVNALDGAPGVRSARYAGDESNDSKNVAKLLQALSASTDRKARFVTVLTLITGKSEKLFEGEVRGTIAFEPRGTGGFGYDPVFIPTGMRSTFAEISPSEKNRISHRYKATEKLIAYLLSENIASH